MGLLKTVFEVNLGLFGGSAETRERAHQTERKDSHPVCDSRPRWRNSDGQSYGDFKGGHGQDLG
jgi:hypothetical protein